MTVTYKTTSGQPLTEKEIKEIKRAQSLKPQFDEDCPELSDSMLKSLKAATRNRNRILDLKKA